MFGLISSVISCFLGGILAIFSGFSVVSPVFLLAASKFFFKAMLCILAIIGIVIFEFVAYPITTITYFILSKTRNGGEGYDGQTELNNINVKMWNETKELMRTDNYEFTNIDEAIKR